MSIGDRIKKLRKALDLTQQEFADKLKLSRSNIATYEVGKNNPADAVINLICREFNVNEQWLRSGEGKMCRKLDDDEELEQIIKSISTSGDESIKRLIRAYWRLSDSGKAGFRELLDNLVTEYESGRNAPAVPSTSAGEMTDAEIHAEVDRQLMGEKVAVDELSVSGPGKSDTATA